MSEELIDKAIAVLHEQGEALIAARAEVARLAAELDKAIGEIKFQVERNDRGLASLKSVIDKLVDRTRQLETAEAALSAERETAAGMRGLLDNVESRYSEAIQLYTKVREKYAEVKLESEPDERYWQGKKDGIRLVLALIATDVEDRERWKRIQESSQDYSEFDSIALAAVPGDGAAKESAK